MDIKEFQMASEEQRIALRQLTEAAAKPFCKFLEVGSWCGDSTIILAKVAKQYNGLVFCIDWWKGNVGTELLEIATHEDIFQHFWKRICSEGLDEIVIPIRCRSEFGPLVLKENNFDLVFIDADHRYEAVLSDISHYAPLVKRNDGILCGHDCEGFISDYDVTFLQKGKNEDYYQTVHCGVVLAVGSFFHEYSINHSIWSVRAKEKDRWEPTNLVFRGIRNKRQQPPPALGITENYLLYRYGRLVYAVPRFLKDFDITEQEDRECSEVRGGETIEEVEKLIGENTNTSPAFCVPQSVEKGYRGFNIVRFKDKYYAFAQSLGPIDLPLIEEREINEYQECGKCVVGNSLYEAKHLVDQIICKALEKEVETLHKALDESESKIRNL